MSKRMYKCKFCGFVSFDLEEFLFHVREHEIEMADEL
ncbi:hypothetical protein SACC_09510 [Saccharolobus caldissimus]|uniref:C2H2-type domain-containing protein n=1 Tax=Saccharolobus caldissimus TaxID=1702097 RepID=A0AAQ4CQ53_9CREN|nr:hypothetical protein SACC_09510 [Saccharolobus caldissimus]